MYKYNYVPNELVNRDMWIVWKKYKGKKIPISVNTRKAIAIKSDETYSDFYNAVDLSRKYDGVGIVLNNSLCCVDLDNCFNDNNELNSFAIDIINRLNSYTEISPSGKGIHILFYSEYELFNKADRIEAYSNNRYITITGNIYNNMSKIEHRNKEIDDINKEFFKPKPIYNDIKQPPQSTVRGISFEDDIKLWDKIKHSKIGYSIQQKMNTPTETGLDDDSAKDVEILRLLAYWTYDANQIERLIRNYSIRQRNKWNEPRGKYANWLQYEIDKAITYQKNRIYNKRIDKINKYEKNVG